jgi:hypothetical protein
MRNDIMHASLFEYAGYQAILDERSQVNFELALSQNAVSNLKGNIRKKLFLWFFTVQFLSQGTLV